MFEELKKENRKTEFDSWLLRRSRPVKSNYYRRNIDIVSNDLINGDYDDLEKIDIYSCENPLLLLDVMSKLLINETFIERDDKINKSYSTPIRRYLEWVYSYLLVNGESELAEKFKDKALHYDSFRNGEHKLDFALCGDNKKKKTEEDMIFSMEGSSSQKEKDEGDDIQGTEKLWLMVRNPAVYGDFDYRKIGEELRYSIFQNDKDGVKRKLVNQVQAGQYVLGYESTPQRTISAFLKVLKPSDGSNILFECIEYLADSCKLKYDDIAFPERLKDPNKMRGWIRSISLEEYKQIVKTVRERQIPNPRNRIIFGAPGTGKSNLLKKQSEGFPDKQVERVTFHPEYSYFDFVGSYKPVMVEKDGGESIVYRFEAGPFARMLKKALSKDSVMNQVPHLLLIEEINRARVAAVFGDMFQLLDRSVEGRSEYAITPSRDLLNYLTDDNEDGEGVDLPNGKLYLPENLYIWATMNSADQGVFPMDTAFKRRWSFEYIHIDNNEDDLTGNYGKLWNALRKRINGLLQEAGINEDKQMGPFFLKVDELSNEETFKKAIKEKVIMYLYEDAARHHREQVFNNAKKRFSDICREYDKGNDIFKISTGIND